MQRTITEKLASKLGLNIERNDVIQALGWPGSGGKEYGYRLNPFTLVPKKKGELKHCQISSINKKKSPQSTELKKLLQFKVKNVVRCYLKC